MRSGFIFFKFFLFFDFLFLGDFYFFRLFMWKLFKGLRYLHEFNPGKTAKKKDSPRSCFGLSFFFSYIWGLRKLINAVVPAKSQACSLPDYRCCRVIYALSLTLCSHDILLGEAHPLHSYTGAVCIGQMQSAV